MHLLRSASHQHFHVDWYMPGDWLGTTGFVVLPEADEADVQSVTAKWLGRRPRLQACLAAAADPAPMAWVRVAAMQDGVASQAVLADLLAAAQENLRKTAVQAIAWLAVESWPNQWLPDLGFSQVNAIETYVKESVHIPEAPTIPGLTIRGVLDKDMPRLAALEAMAFGSLWRHSAAALQLARRQVFSFDVALLEDEIVGFQLSTPSEDGVHLVRLTVDPHQHRSGIGTALLAHAIGWYHQRGVTKVSLNTQVDNVVSQRLYKKFDFQPTGQQFPVWLRPF